MEKGIDYNKLATAKSYYELAGFKYIELPWTVEEDMANITKPVECRNFFVNEKVLVASGEQSFLELSLKNNLTPGKYFGITPCFRDESVLDRYHNDYFIKLEIFQSIDVNMDSLGRIIDIAQKFFNSYCMDTVKTIADEGFDICTQQGIELGSYGIREFNGFNWIYGTGLAEPRLSRVI